jgi:hypothetical protein
MISAHYLSRFLCSPLYNTGERELPRVGGNAARVAGTSVDSASDQHIPRSLAVRKHSDQALMNLASNQEAGKIRAQWPEGF